MLYCLFKFVGFIFYNIRYKAAFRYNILIKNIFFLITKGSFSLNKKANNLIYFLNNKLIPDLKTFI